MGILLDGLTSGGALLLAVLGLYIIYGVLGVINMAHGEFLMVGAYTCSIVRSAGLNFPLAVIAGGIVVGALGALVERLVIRRLHRRADLSSLLATWGVSICLIELVRISFGPAGKSVDAPFSGAVSIAGTVVSTYQLFVAIVGLALAALLGVVLYWTRVGLQIRAVVECPEVAEGLGIRSKNVYFWSFIVGSALAGLAGALLAPLSSVTPLMGFDYSLRCFMVVIAGGVDHWSGPMLGTAIVAGSKSLLSSFFGVTGSTLGSLLITLFVIILRSRKTGARK